MAEKQQYQDGDFVKVVNEAGEVQADEVPKAWVGTDLLPEGSKAATKAQLKAEQGEESSNSES